MARTPLTHHDIMLAVAPFTRAGRRVDLGASDRAARRVAFAERERDGAESGVRESLSVEVGERGGLTLTRTLTREGAPPARCIAEGGDAQVLLARLDAFPPSRQFRAGQGYAIAFSHRLESATGIAMLEAAEARIGPVVLRLTMTRVTGVPANLEIVDAEGAGLDLTEDLLAVQGWSWSRLTRVEGGWKSVLRLAGADEKRARDAEAKFERTAAHLAAVLAEPPAAFHRRCRVARMRVFARRAMPLVVAGLLIAAATAVPALDLAQDSPFRMLIFNAPPLLMVLFFAFREVPRIEIPPWPRPPAPAWRRVAGASEALR
jgi:hypothetical protein